MQPMHFTWPLTWNQSAMDVPLQEPEASGNTAVHHNKVTVQQGKEYIYIYLYSFGRCFYPKRLKVKDIGKASVQWETLL